MEPPFFHHDSSPPRALPFRRSDGAEDCGGADGGLDSLGVSMCQILYQVSLEAARNISVASQTEHSLSAVCSAKEETCKAIKIEIEAVYASHDPTQAETSLRSWSHTTCTVHVHLQTTQQKEKSWRRDTSHLIINTNTAWYLV